MISLIKSQRFQNLKTISYIIGLIFLFIVLSGFKIEAVEPIISGKIKITVRDEAELPLPGVLIQLTMPDGNVRSLQSDANGTATFLNLKTGDYQINASIEGFQSLNQSVVLKDAGSIELNLQLIQKLSETVTVSGESVPAAERGSSTATEIKPEDVKNLPLRPGTVADALPLIPGVVRSPEGELKISGAGEDHSAFLVNSVDVTDPATGQFGVTVPIDSVESLRVYKSPFLAEYGRFTAGVVAVETKRAGDKWDFELNDPLPEFRIRSLQLHGIRDMSPRVTFGGPLISKQFYLQESVEYELSYNPVRTLPFPENETKKQSINSFTQLDYLFSSTHTLTGTFHVNGVNMDYVGLNFFNERPVTPNLDTQDFTATAIDRMFFGNHLLESSLGFRRGKADVFAQGQEEMTLTPTGNEGNYFSQQNRNDERFEWREAFSVAPIESFGKHNLKFGTALTYTKNSGEFSARPVNILDNDGVLLRRIEYINGSPFDRYDLELSLFAQDHWLLKPNFALDLGTRLERQGITESFRAAPRLGFAWSPFKNQDTAVRGGIGLFFDRVPLTVFSFEHYPEQVITTYGPNGEIIDGPRVFLNVIGQASGKFPFSYNEQDPGNFSPHSTAWNLEIEHPFSKFLRLRANYLENRSSGVITITPGVVNGQNALILDGDGRSFYRQLELTARLSFKENQQFFFSYVRSRSRGNLNEFNNYLGNFPFPIVRPDQFGILGADLPNRFLFWAEQPLPWKMSVHPLLEWRNGFPYSTFDALQNYVGTPNAQRFPAFFSLDTAISKDFKVTDKYTFRFTLSGFNLTNHLNSLEVHSNVDDPQFGEFFGNYKRRFRLDFDVLW